MAGTEGFWAAGGDGLLFVCTQQILRGSFCSVSMPGSTVWSGAISVVRQLSSAAGQLHNCRLICSSMFLVELLSSSVRCETTQTRMLPQPQVGRTRSTLTMISSSHDCELQSSMHDKSLELW